MARLCYARLGEATQGDAGQGGAAVVSVLQRVARHTPVDVSSVTVATTHNTARHLV